MNYAKRKEFRQQLKQLGCPYPVIWGGVHRLVVIWEATAKSVAASRDITLEDYINGIDARILIHSFVSSFGAGGLTHGSDKQLETADRFFLAAVVRSDQPGQPAELPRDAHTLVPVWLSDADRKDWQAVLSKTSVHD